MKELWIHAGMPKNGTSALQVFLANNIENLKEEGLDYVELEDISDAKKGQISSGNAGNLAKLLRSDEYKKLYNSSESSYYKLLQYVKSSRSSKFLISSEFFASVPATRYDRLIKDLREINVVAKIIYYVRRQDQFLMSAYMQAVKRHRYTKYPENFVYDNYKKGQLDYYQMSKNFEKIFGKENIKVFLFDSTKKHKNGIVGHFIETLLKDTPKWMYTEKFINTSPSPKELLVMLFANKYKPRMRFSDILIENSVIANNSKAYIKHKIISPDVLDLINDYYNESNRALEKEYLNGDEFPKYERDNNYIDMKEIKYDARDVLEVAMGFLVNLDTRISKLEKY